MGRYEKHFNYAHTCPEIDRQIEGLKSDMMETIKTYLSDIEDHDINYSNLVSDLYRDVSDHFEAVRSTNANMRDEAGYQIVTLNERISELESQLEDKNSEIERLNSEIDDLESQVE